ncbi:MAG: HlyC/CorC family transporter [Fimbriimonadaceae bacterium]|nr:HlyC/CorC family transporter [Fimbriimonadaceae bacterium]
MSDHPELWWSAAALLLGLWLAARLALTHAAVAGVSRARLRSLADEGNWRAEQLVLLLARREAVQGALRLAFGTTLVLAVSAAWWLDRQLPRGRGDWAVALAVLLAATILAELLPRLSGSARPESTALRSVGWVRWSYRLLGPLVRPVLAEAETATRDEGDDEPAAENFRELVDAAPIRPAQRRRITEILAFPDRTAGDVMVPRVELVAVERETPLPAVAALVEASGYSRLPVYHDSVEDIVGMIHARDLLAWLPREGVAADLMRRPLYVTEAMRLDALLRELRTEHRSVAVVVDEYGGTAGLVTVEDVIEEIVGEIHDETDAPQDPVRPRPGGGWQISARCELDHLAEVTGLTLASDSDVNTVGGLVMALAGDLPEPGEVLVGTSDQGCCLWLVEAAEGTRLLAVALRLVAPQPVEAFEPAPGDPPWLVPATTPLATLASWLPVEPQPAAGVAVGELLGFWPPAQRAGQTVRWHGLRVTLAEPGGDLVRCEPAG